MKTLTVSDSTIPTLITAVMIFADMEKDILTEDFPLSLIELRRLADKTDIKIKTELSTARKEFNKRLDNIIQLEILKSQLESL